MPVGGVTQLEAPSLPLSIVLKVPEAASAQALSVLLERGAPAQFCQRKVGNETKQFLVVEESDRIPEHVDGWQEYRSKLKTARSILLNDPLLSSKVFYCEDPLCWPPPHLWKSIVLMRCEVLASSNNVSGAVALKEALLRHVSEVEGCGTFPLVLESPPAGFPRPILYSTAEEILAESGGEAAKESAKAQQKAAIAQKFAELRQKSSKAGGNVDEMKAGEFSFAARKRDAQLIVASASVSPTSLVHLRPARQVQRTLTVDFTAQRMLSSLDVVRMNLPAAVQDAFKQQFGTSWTHLLHLHVQFYRRELARQLFSHGGDSMSCEHISQVSGVLYAVDDFVQNERDHMSQCAMMQKLSASAGKRLRLLRGVYVTQIEVSKCWVIHKNMSLAVADDHQHSGMKKDNHTVRLTEAEVSAFQSGFAVASLADEIGAGNVKIVYQDETPTALQQSSTSVLPSTAAASGRKRPRAAADEKEEEETAAMPSASSLPDFSALNPSNFPASDLQFSKQVQLSQATIATQFVTSIASASRSTTKKKASGAGSAKASSPAAGGFIPGQHYFLLHGSRMSNQSYQMAETTQEVQQTIASSLSDDSCRRDILRSLRQIGEYDAAERQKHAKILSDEIVEEKLLEVFAKYGGVVQFSYLIKEPAILGIPAPQIRKLLKKMGHYDKRNHRWVKH